MTDPQREVPYRERRPAPRWLLAVAGASAVVAALAMVTVDGPVARGVAAYHPWGLWDRTLDVLEWTLGLPLVPWTSGIVLALCMAVAAAVPRWRHRAPAWMFLAASHILGRIAMVHAKDLFGRLRPLEWLKHGGGGAFSGTFWRGGVSFPSGHVVLFASVAIPLIALEPRAWPTLAVVAFAMCARIAVDAHFVSDVVAGITVVALVTYLVGLAIRPLPPVAPSRRD